MRRRMKRGIGQGPEGFLHRGVCPHGTGVYHLPSTWMLSSTQKLIESPCSEFFLVFLGTRCILSYLEAPP